MSGQDLWGAGDQAYLIPHGLDLPAGPLVITRIDGLERAVDPATVATYAVSVDEAAVFYRASVDDAVTRAGVALGALGHLIRDAGREHAGPRPESLDALLGWTGEPGANPALARLMGGLMALSRRGRAEPAAVKRLADEVADQWEGGEASADLRAALRAAADAVSPIPEPGGGAPDGAESP